MVLNSNINIKELDPPYSYPGDTRDLHCSSTTSAVIMTQCQMPPQLQPSLRAHKVSIWLIQGDVASITQTCMYMSTHRERKTHSHTHTPTYTQLTYCPPSSAAPSVWEKSAWDWRNRERRLAAVPQSILTRDFQVLQQVQLQRQRGTGNSAV